MALKRWWIAAAVAVAITVELVSVGLTAPARDGTPTTKVIPASGNDYTINYPTLTGGSDGHGTGDCCIIALSTSIQCLNGANSNCVSGVQGITPSVPSGWSISNISGSAGAFPWSSNTRNTCIYTHVFTNGDANPDFGTVTTGCAGEGVLMCVTGNNACTLSNAFTAQANASGLTISGPGLPAGNAGDLHIFFPSSSGTETTYTSYNNSFSSGAFISGSTTSLGEADVVVASTGAQPTALATQTPTARTNVGIQGVLEAASPTATATATATATPTATATATATATPTATATATATPTATATATATGAASAASTPSMIGSPGFGGPQPLGSQATGFGGNI